MFEDTSNCVAIVSGGFDSVTLLHYLVKQQGLTPAVLTFQYGQKHSKEVEYARAQVQQLGLAQHLVLDLTVLTPLFAQSALVSTEIAIPTAEEVTNNPQPPTYVPNRNMIFLALAVAYAETNGAQAVYFGAQKHDLYGYWDTTPDFLERLNHLYLLNRDTAVQIQAPFVHYSKADILRLGLDLGVDYSLTWSCYQGNEAACGTCPTCAERLSAFAALGLQDPLPYQ